MFLKLHDVFAVIDSVVFYSARFHGPRKFQREKILTVKLEQDFMGLFGLGEFLEKIIRLCVSHRNWKYLTALALRIN